MSPPADLEDELCLLQDILLRCRDCVAIQTGESRGAAFIRLQGALRRGAIPERELLGALLNLGGRGWVDEAGLEGQDVLLWLSGRERAAVAMAPIQRLLARW